MFYLNYSFYFGSCLALRYRQDSYRHVIETVPSTSAQPSRSNQQYPPPNLWQPADSGAQQQHQQQQQQIFMTGIHRPFPGLAGAQPTPLQPSSAIPLLTNSNVNVGQAPLPSNSSYLTNYTTAAVVQASTLPLTSNNAFTITGDEQTINRHYQHLDTGIGSVELNAPSQFQSTTTSTNSYYPSQRTHTSPSASAFPPLFAYAPPAFNHHHHHHLSSTVDDGSLLIQNPSLT